MQRFLGNARQGHVDKPLGVSVHVVAIASHNNQVGHVLRGSNKGLVTVQVDLAVLTGVGRAHIIPRGSCTRLGHCVVEHLLTGAHEGKDLFLLFLGALTQNGIPAGKLVENVGGATGATEGLVSGGKRHPIGTQTAVFLRKEDLVKTELANGRNPFLGVFGAFIAFLEVLLPVTRLHQFGESIDHQLLVFAQ